MLTNTKTIDHNLTMMDEAKPKHPGGRPSKYDPEYAPRVKSYCLLGLKDAQICELLDISESTFNLWKNGHPELSEAIRAGRKDADSKVATAMYDKACAGDTTAAIFWLKNRHRDMWRDRQDVEHVVNVINQLTDNELEAEVARLQSKLHQIEHTPMIEADYDK